MALRWFDTKELDQFADAVVAELVRHHPPPGGGITGKKAFERLRRSFGATFDRIDRFLAAHKLNIYKKAHFANRMRWALAEAGYPADFVSTMTREVVTHVTIAASGRSKP
jgi:hypothetical protein